LPTASLEGKSDLTPKIHDCKRCGLFANCTTPKIPYTGQGKRRILIIGPSVNHVEDSSGNTRRGSSYNYLARNLKQVSIDLEEDCWYTHATRCYTKNNLGITTQSACHRMLMKEIEALDPVVIVPAAPEAFDILLYERVVGRASTASYFDWCGELIPDQMLLRWVAPIYSASFVDDKNDKQHNPYILFWHKHMQNMLIPLSRPKVIDTYTHACKTEKDAISVITEAQSWTSFAFDYETTGIKPYDEGHKIAYISISDGEIAYSFPNFNSAEFQGALQRLLTNDAIKIAHNANFERSWTREILGYEVKNLTQDTMILQHCLNNRKPTGLKFLTYARYGFMGYDADADEYLRASTEDERARGTNAFNRVFDAPVNKMLQYNALDSLFTAWLFKDLYQELDRKHQLPGYKFFMELSLAFYNMHREGFSLDMELMARTEGEIEKAIRPYIDTVMEDPLIVQQWNGAHKFNPRSDYDIRTLLFKILKLEPKEFTDKGQPSVDAESLILYRDKVPILSSLFQVKRLSKLGGTYIRQMKAEHNGGMMHSFFSLNRVVTYRSGSSNVNLQNSPKRDKESRKIIRSLYIPKRGHRLVEYDFKAMEVSVAAAVTNDRNLIAYVTDSSKDMHRDLAKSLFMVDEVSKNLRGNATKGAWTFAQFYGSYWKQCAAGVWAEIDIPNAVDVYGFDVIKHLKKCGIKSYEKWEKHCEEQEYILWNEFFPGYRVWREETYKRFCEQGYIDYVNGFRYYGPASRNEVLNGPIQGPAFSVQAWSFKEMDKYLRENKFNSQLICQVHDSELVDMDPAEEGLVDKMMHKFATEEVRKHWSWITVPLIMEKDRGEIDGSWAEMTSEGVLSD